MRLTIFVFASAALVPFFWPQSVRAATPSNCFTYAATLAKDLETNTTQVDDLASPYDPSPDHVVQSAAGYNKDVAYSKYCPTPKKLYADALLATWSAWLEHATTHVDPIDTAQLAARKLEKCRVTYQGTNEGATCAAWGNQVAKWQNEWSATSSGYRRTKRRYQDPTSTYGR